MVIQDMEMIPEKLLTMIYFLTVKECDLNIIKEVKVPMRRKDIAKIATVLDGKQSLILNRGKREHVEVGDTYGIFHDDKLVALGFVSEVQEKMCMVVLVWQHHHCPILYLGQEMERMRSYEAAN